MADAKLTQLGLEVLTRSSADAKLAQLGVEVLTRSSADAKLVQLGVEILTPNGAFVVQTVGAVTLQGYAPSLLILAYNVTAEPPPGSVDLQGRAPTVKAATAFPVGSVDLQGLAPTAKVTLAPIVPPGSVDLTGHAPGLFPRMPGVGTLDLLGRVPIASRGGWAVASGAIVFTGASTFSEVARRGIVFTGSSSTTTVTKGVGCILFEDCPHDPLVVDCPTVSAERPASGDVCVPGAYSIDVIFRGSL